MLFGSGSSLGNVTGCTFRGNRALDYGAGIYMRDSHLTSMSITTTTFVDNKCDDLDYEFWWRHLFPYRYRQYSRCKRQPFLEQLGDGWRCSAL